MGFTILLITISSVVSFMVGQYVKKTANHGALQAYENALYLSYKGWKQLNSPEVLESFRPLWSRPGSTVVYDTVSALAYQRAADRYQNLLMDEKSVERLVIEDLNGKQPAKVGNAKNDSDPMC